MNENGPGNGPPKALPEALERLGRLEEENALLRRQLEGLERDGYRMRAGVDQIPIPMFWKDVQGRYTACNAAFEAILGRTREELIGKTTGDVAPADVAEVHTRKDREMLAGPAPQIYEAIVEVADGSRHPALFLRGPLRGPRGEAMGLVGAILDLRERKAAEEALQKSEESERYLREQLTILHQVTNDLSTAGSSDELCRRAIEMGRERLGFDRMGLWFAGDDPQYLKGSYGTDEAGNLRDERASRAWLTPGIVIAEVMGSHKPMVLRDDSPLFDDDRHVVGRGQQAIASLWDGERIIGCLTTDNLLRNRSLTQNECEVLMLYASALGHLCSRQRAQEALEQADRRLRSVVENSWDVIFQTDLEGRYTYGNPAAERMTGYPLKEVIGMSLFQVVAPEYHGLVRERLAKRAAGEELPQPFQFEIRHRDGHRVCVELVTSPLVEDGVLIGSQGIARDITDRLRAERELEATRGRLQNLIADSPAVVYSQTVGDPIDITYVSPNVQRIMGCTPEQMRDNDSRARRLHPEEAAMVHQALGHPSQLGLGRLEHRFRAPDGSWRWFLNQFNVLPGPAGEPAEIIGHVLDITDRKEAELALQAARGRLEHLISGSPAVIYSQLMADPPRLTYVSPNVREVFGYAPEQVTDQRYWLQRVHPDDRQGVLDVLSRLPQDRAGRIEYRYRHADGSWRWVLDEFNVFRSSPEGVPEGVGHVIDITARKEAEEALRSAHAQLVKGREEERKRLASELHDSLGQELISLHLRMQGLLPELASGLDKGRAGELDRILQGCQDLIGEVRGISHGLYPPLLESVGLAAALREMAGRLPSPVPIRVECSPSVEKLRWPIEVEIALFRIAQEALGNAIRHSRAKRIKVALEYKRRTAVLSIRDDGLGFDPGAQAAGLGLSTMRDRAQTIGGELLVESRPGSTRVEARVPAEANRRG